MKVAEAMGILDAFIAGDNHPVRGSDWEWRQCEGASFVDWDETGKMIWWASLKNIWANEYIEAFAGTPNQAIINLAKIVQAR